MTHAQAAPPPRQGPQPRPEIAAMAPYMRADLVLPEGGPQAQLAQNESAHPPSPAALAAAAEALAEARLYPDQDAGVLTAAIAETHGLAPEGLIAAAGSMELIAALLRAYAGPGDAVLAPEFAYAFFRTSARAVGAHYITAPEAGFTVSVPALLAAVTSETRIAVLANPGNPTGTRIPRAEILALREGLPADVLLVVDEAYGEFADAAGEGLFDLPARGDTVILRTFSKAYALAGMRIGWGLFPPAVAAEMRKLLTASLTGPAIAAATAAMRDQAHMAAIVADTAEQRARFAARLADLGLTAVPSHTNFVLIVFASGEEAARAEAWLRRSGIALRGMAGYGLAHCLRATIGTAEEMARTAERLGAWVAEGRP